MEVIDDDEGPPHPFIDVDDPAPSKAILDVEPAVAAMEAAAPAALGDDVPPVTVSFDSGSIEDRAMNEEEDSMVVPPSVMTEDERPRRRAAEPPSSRVLSFVHHRGNRGSATATDDARRDDDVNPANRGSDSTYRVPVAALVTDRDSGETVVATHLEPWWKQRRTVLLLFAAIVFVAVAIALGTIGLVRLRTSNDEPTGASDGASITAASSIVSYPPTLVQLRKEGVLRCGVPVKLGFSAFNQVTGEKEGMSVDFCKAVAAAVLGPDGRVELIDVTSVTRFAALANRSIDVLMYGDTHTMERDFHEVRLDAPQMRMI